MEIPNSENYGSRNSNSPAQSNEANNTILITPDNIEKILSLKKCKNHPEQNADLLHLEKNAKTPRICLSCVQEDDISSRNYLQIKEVLKAQSDSDLLSYPVLTDPSLRKAIFSHIDILDSDKDKIDIFFQELINQIYAKIDTCKQSQKLKIIQLEDTRQRGMGCWKEIMDIDTLKQIIQEGNEDKLIQFIRNHIQNSQINTKKIKDICDQFDANNTAFSEEQPNQIRTLICSLLEEINFFGGNLLSPLKSVEHFGQEDRNQLQKKQQELDELYLKFNAYKDKAEQDMFDLIEENKDLRKELDLEKKSTESLNQQLLEVNKELSALKSINLLPTTKLILSDWLNSYSFSVNCNNQELELQNSNEIDMIGIAYFNFILNPMANYVIHVRLQQEKGQEKVFGFGLVSDSKKDCIQDSSDGLCYNEQNGKGGVNTLVKGTDILSDKDLLESKNLEMRINIKKRYLRVGLLPNYDSVVEADEPEWINPDTPYRFFMLGLNKKAKIVITKLETARKFDDKM